MTLVGMTIFITASFMVFAAPHFTRGCWRTMSRVTSLLLPIPFFLCGLFHELVTVPLNANDTLTLTKGFCDQEAAPYLAKAESAERLGKYGEAEGYYKQWIDLRRRSHPGECLDGVLARILDLEGCHGEAEKYYCSFEKYAADQLAKEALAKPTADLAIPKAQTRGPRHGVIVVADGRLLRILQTIPRETALSEFEFAGSILKCANLTAYQLGQQRSIIDRRPFIEDFRGYDGGPVTTPGKVVRAQQLRRHLSKIGPERALVEFSFADYYFPRPGARLVRENYPVSRLAGYESIGSVRDLMSEQIAILDEREFEKLKKMSGL